MGEVLKFKGKDELLLPKPEDFFCGMQRFEFTTKGFHSVVENDKLEVEWYAAVPAAFVWTEDLLKFHSIPAHSLEIVLSGTATGGNTFIEEVVREETFAMLKNLLNVHTENFSLGWKMVNNKKIKASKVSEGGLFTINYWHNKEMQKFEVTYYQTRSFDSTLKEINRYVSNNVIPNYEIMLKMVKEYQKTVTLREGKNVAKQQIPES